MLSFDYYVALWCERQLYFKERGVLYFLGPVELQQHIGGSMVEWVPHFDVLIELKLVPIQLDSCSSHMDVGCTDWSQIPPSNWIEQISVQKLPIFKDHTRVKVKDLEEHQYIRV